MTGTKCGCVLERPGGGTPIVKLYGYALPERATFFKFEGGTCLNGSVTYHDKVEN